MPYTIDIIDAKDYKAYFQLVDDNRSRLAKYFPGTISEIQSIDDAKSQLRQSEAWRKDKLKYLFGIYASESIIGYIDIKNIDWKICKCELGYFVDAAYEGKGIMSKYISTVIDYCFSELGILKIFLRIASENKGSIRLAEKNGFVREGILRNEFRMQSGELIDVEYFGLIKPKD